MINDCFALQLFEPTIDTAYTLPAISGWPEQHHQFEKENNNAIQAALATGRPLLVRGEPGTGKSQLARAAAHVLGRPFIYEVITSKTDVNDLLWHFDAVARLGEAQIQSAGAGITKYSAEKVREILSPDKFISPGKIWWAINWQSAIDQSKLCGSPVQSGLKDGWKKGCVLLIDEIDKADSELPNGLLECFSNRSFQVPYFAHPIEHNPDQPAPLVIITTNEERELPPAFLRRCLVLQLHLPKDPDNLKKFLIKRGNVHFEGTFKDQVSDYHDVLELAADQLIIDRSDSEKTGLSKPGQAEYLDLCNAVLKIAVKKGIKGTKILNEIANFSLKKNPVNK